MMCIIGILHTHTRAGHWPQGFALVIRSRSSTGRTAPAWTRSPLLRWAATQRPTMVWPPSAAIRGTSQATKLSWSYQLAKAAGSAARQALQERDRPAADWTLLLGCNDRGERRNRVRRWNRRPATAILVTDVIIRGLSGRRTRHRRLAAGDASTRSSTANGACSRKEALVLADTAAESAVPLVRGAVSSDDHGRPTPRPQPRPRLARRSLWRANTATERSTFRSLIDAGAVDTCRRCDALPRHQRPAVGRRSGWGGEPCHSRSTAPLPCTCRSSSACSD